MELHLKKNIYIYLSYFVLISEEKGRKHSEEQYPSFLKKVIAF